MEKQACRIGGIAVAAGIGLALATGHGLANADPATSESDAGASSAAGPAATVDSTQASPADDPSSDADPSDDEDSEDDQDIEPDDGDTEPVGSDAPDSPVIEESTDEDDAGGGEESDPAAGSSAPEVPEPETTAPADAVTDSDEDADGSAAAGTGAASPPSDAPASEVEASPPPTAVTAVPEPAAAVIAASPPSFVSKVLSAFGITSTPRPAQSPLMTIVLAWLRRQLGDPSTSPSGPTTSSLQPLTQSTSSSPTINVRDYGAVGDGVTDDSAALKAAEAALTSGARLYFPEGDYRFAQQNPAGNAAIVLKGLSNVTVEFAVGARLLMDNLAPNGHGTSHGLRVEGAASHVTILNATIEWATRPSARSFGDGISVLGWPSDSPPPSGWTGSSGTVEFVSIVNARVVNAPQAGVVVMGASDVTVTNMTAIGTLADGLHFNANRRVTVNGLVAQNVGDDGLAFVTYYHATQPWTYGPTDGPFNQAGIGEWNNGGSTATNISVTGGQANGFRVQGGYDITISNVTVIDKEFGFHVNSAKATGPGDWTSLASRDIRISNVVIEGVQTGIVLATNNINGTEDPMWWDFAGVVISDVTIRGATNWSVAVETPSTTTSKFAGVTLRNIYAETGPDPTGGGNGGILLASLRDSAIDNVRLVSSHEAGIYLLGAGQVRTDLSADDLPSSNLIVDDLILEGPGRILIQDIAGVQFGNVASYGAAGTAVMLYRVKDASFENITAYLPGRGSGEGHGVRLLLVYDIDIANIAVTMDDHVGSTWWAVEFGGGNPTEGRAGERVYVDTVTYVSDRDHTDSDIGIQGGTYGPADWYIGAMWRHEGEATPQWRSAVYGDVSPV